MVNSKVPGMHYDKSVLAYKPPPRADYTREEALDMLPLICKFPRATAYSPKKRLRVKGTTLPVILKGKSPKKFSPRKRTPSKRSIRKPKMTGYDL